MTTDHIFLLWLLVLPLGGAIVVALLGPQRRDAIRWISFGVSVMTFVLALVVAGRFMAVARSHTPVDHPTWDSPVSTFEPEFVPGSPPENRHVTNWNLLPLGPGNVQFYIGIDGLNVWLVVLTAVLMLPSVLVSWNAITERSNEFYAHLLALQTAMMGIFMAFDIILFYVFFELSLVPLFFLIGIWGGTERRYAARKFFIYTLTGSLITLLGVLGIVLTCYQQSGQLTFALPQLVKLVHESLSSTDAAKASYWNYVVQFWVFLALMAGFAVKVPLVPLHTWLPLAHVEAPTAGSVDLAGVLLKVGAYGFLRLCIPLAPDASLTLGLPLVTGLAAVGIVYGAFCAYAQDDMKKMIAYSSVSHLGMCMLGMYALNITGITGSLLQMINHGLSTALLFLLIGMLYERYHTRKIADYGGMSTRLPLFGACFVFTVLTSVGLPGLNGFVGEALVLFGIFDREWQTSHGFPTLAVVGSTGIVLGAWYLFTLTRSMLFGEVKEPTHNGHAIEDLNIRELGIVVPIAILCVFLGVFPQPVLRTSEPDISRVAEIADRARLRLAHERKKVADAQHPQPAQEPAVAAAVP